MHRYRTKNKLSHQMDNNDKRITIANNNHDNKDQRALWT